MTDTQIPIVYTTAQCPACERTKQILTQQGVPYQAVDTSDSQRQALIEQGHRAFPVVSYAGQAFAGFQMPKLRELARQYFAAQAPAHA